MSHDLPPAGIAADAAFVRQALVLLADSECAGAAEQALRDLERDASDECLAQFWKLTR
ncbi:hypothetical protein [Sphingomonas parapaucimobilis]|uniref:Uncharacterized protein n=1 Tax=Sphingomonas parapaucimobilis NBRC 15100 TaxID=1219049 RepID=A0A0A1W5T0_9SPHN|nr:hypothetical protein [Sphingomonas parapaucimobilis]GAM00537.1 hypothetical protein SP5_034_01110 [Sphingomonas parapaucimobilis NBRC 15100]